MKKIFLSVLMTLFLASYAQAYSVGFDVDGGGNFQIIDAFQLTGVDEPDDSAAAGGSFGDANLWSYEDADRNFTEQFTLSIDYAELAAGGKYGVAGPGNLDDDDFDRFYADVSLAGQVIGDTAYFSAGAVTMYLDNNADADYDGGDDLVATLALSYTPQDMALSDTVLDTGLEGDIDLVFNFTETYGDYWDGDADDLADAGLFLALLGGKITATTVLPIYDGQEQVGSVVGWDTTGIDSQFAAVPEPATMLLFGIGLLGAACVTRKKFK